MNALQEFYLRKKPLEGSKWKVLYLGNLPLLNMVLRLCLTIIDALLEEQHSQ